MADQFDVVVVGGRVAGAPLATHLARAGLQVCLVDRAQFPSNALSTHLFQNIPALERLGVLPRLLGTGAPLLTQVRVTLDGAEVTGSFPDLPMLSVRRPYLDQALLDNAVASGVDARLQTRVTGLVVDGGRVAGVRVKHAGSATTTLRAPVVVGADGRTSTVARLVGARRYNVVDNERAGVWAYYEGVDSPPRVNFCRTGQDLFAFCPTDGGTFLAIAIPTLASLPAYRDGDGTGFDRMVKSCRPLADLVAGSRRLRKPVVVARFQGYFRESAGAGWCLIGDAGHFKDPTPGQGIGDALRQAERLAGFLVRGLETGLVDQQLHAWWAWRDQDAREAYWFAQDLGRGGLLSPLVHEVMRMLLIEDPDGIRAFWELLHHRAPSQVLTPGRLFGASGRLLVRGRPPRRQVMAEVTGLMALDRRRRRLDRQPLFEPGGAAAPIVRFRPEPQPAGEHPSSVRI